MDTAENVMKNGIIKFQCNPVTHFQDTSTYKTFNQKFQPLIFLKNILKVSKSQKPLNLQ